jgi:ParB-like chromosome segregation protein Spo0J
MGLIEARRAQVEVVETELESRGKNTTIEQVLLAQVPAVRVAIGSLVAADSPRLSGENPEHVEALANAPGELPPIIVHRASMRILDGLHRLRAAEFRGQDEIRVRFFDGADADAFVVAVMSNIAHGLPLSLADRKAAVTRIIASHPRWSDRLIASATGLAAATIAEMRRKSNDQVPLAGTRIGLDGRARPVNSAERRRTASRLLIDDPSLSLRQVGRIVGISPETVRDVRRRLYDGKNSIPRERGPLQRVHRDTPDQNLQGHASGASQGNLDQVVRQLKLDPTLRFTETGRTLLRLLDVHTISGERWIELCDNIPAHCQGTIANAALGCAEVWKRFSEQLAGQDTFTSA